MNHPALVGLRQKIETLPHAEKILLLEKTEADARAALLGHEWRSETSSFPENWGAFDIETIISELTEIKESL